MLILIVKPLLDINDCTQLEPCFKIANFQRFEKLSTFAKSCVIIRMLEEKQFDLFFKIFSVSSKEFRGVQDLPLIGVSLIFIFTFLN
jgi:hypothetical protein